MDQIFLRDRPAIPLVGENKPTIFFWSKLSTCEVNGSLKCQVSAKGGETRTRFCWIEASLSHEGVIKTSDG